MYGIQLYCCILQTSSNITLPIPTDVENKPYIWAENAFDPIIVKHNQQAYDICEGKIYSKCQNLFISVRCMLQFVHFAFYSV